MPTALIVIDVQHGLFDPAPRPAQADAVITRINQLSARARAAGAPVLWVQHERPGTPLAHGSPGWALAAGLRTEASDTVVRKTTPDSFLDTQLAEHLAAHRVQQVVVCGYASEFCVDTTVRRAAALGWAVTLVADAHTTHDKPHASGAQIRAHENATLPQITSFAGRIRALPADAVVFGPADTVPTAAATDAASGALAASTAAADAHTVVSAEQLAALYPATPTEASLVKESATLLPGYRALLQASPFVVLASIGPGGLDASPRGDPAPLLVVQDERTLLLPDRRGNNRLDSLRNVVADGRVALLCLVPGKNETLRINGHATLSSDPALCQRLAMDGKPPVTVLVIHIEVVYFQCARALLRSGLWQPERWPDTRTLPTAGSLLREATQGRFDGTSYDAALPQRQRDTLY